MERKETDLIPSESQVSVELLGVISGAQAIVAIIDDNLPPSGGEIPPGGPG